MVNERSWYLLQRMVLLFFNDKIKKFVRNSALVFKNSFKKRSKLLLYRYISDTTPAIVVLVLIFIFPKENIFKGKPYEHLMSWKELKDKFPWEVIMLGG
jgi:hypothetical protein